MFVYKFEIERNEIKFNLIFWVHENWNANKELYQQNNNSSETLYVSHHKPMLRYLHCSRGYSHFDSHALIYGWNTIQMHCFRLFGILFSFSACLEFNIAMFMSYHTKYSIACMTKLYWNEFNGNLLCSNILINKSAPIESVYLLLNNKIWLHFILNMK